MPNETPGFRRDLFEIENARNLTRRELIATFVPTKSFWRLLSAKNHIVLGSRGSGKTALAKMMSHDHLSQLEHWASGSSEHKRASQIIVSKAYIGVYVPTRLEWVGGLKNKPWQTEREKEEFFQWRLNLSTCLALLVTLSSCLEAYIEDRGQRARIEAQLSNAIADAWSDGRFVSDTIRGLQEFLENVEHRKQPQLARLRALGALPANEEPAGMSFGTDLFVPLRRAMTLTSRILDLPDDTAWLLCLDEAEFLEPMHHRILNSHLRAYSGNLFVKITTMPYSHYTLDTNSGVPLNVGHDFEYVYIDQDPVLWAGRRGSEGKSFAITLFNKRAQVSGARYRRVNLRELLGESGLLDTKLGEWDPQSANMALLRKHASAETVARAERLANSPTDFQDQSARKVHGALLLREAVKSVSGRKELDVYSGETMAVRCADANPRRLIRIFNSFLLEANWQRNRRKGLYQLSRSEQTRILIAFSTSALSRVQSEPSCGPELYEFIQALGKYMHRALHEEPLTTDQISSIIVDDKISDEHWTLVQRAVGLGLLFPNVNANNPDQMPEREGTFHLAYVLAPHFRILPRKGKARRLATILNGVLEAATQQMALGFSTEGHER